jgi:fructokinase
MQRVLCFGEILWDLLPAGRFLGGAPFNVAYHLARNGCAAQLVSSVGRDAAGDEALARAVAAGVTVDPPSRHPGLPTGTATVQLDDAGQARFEIRQPVAWDDIPVDDVLGQPPPAAVVFGTLALRSPANRTALGRILDAFPQAWIVCDLNLRPPFDDLAPLAPFLRRAHLLKLNADEARRLCRRPSIDTDWRGMSAELAARQPGTAVCLTLGGDGAGLRDGSLWCQVEVPPVTVRDTVGAGDAFTAALVAGRLRFPAATWPRQLRAACALGAFVASRDGAQPDYGDFRIEW